MLTAGTPAPPFTLPDHNGNPVSLADLRGSWVLLWWFPKAATPGCTIEARALRDRVDDFAAAHCVVFGASFDPMAENRRFAEEQRLGFRLLSDEDKAAGHAYQVARMPDDQYAAFPQRTSYLIDPDGVIARAYGVADVRAHAEVVLADLAALSGSR